MAGTARALPGSTDPAHRLDATHPSRVFHQGTTAPGQAGLIRGDRARLRAIVDEQLTVSGRLQVDTALAIMDVLADHLERLRRRPLSTARGVNGARVLTHDIYGVGPLSSLASCAWLGSADRFSSSRKAVRFVGLDIIVRSSDGKTRPRPTLPPRPGSPALAAVRSRQDLRPRLRT
jgi:transposase